eukprot:m.51561 g.51561  ORF g.51561 m.51561 type:complete len:55 (-) comp6620_c0_seq2:81-245(-)
MWNDSIRRDGTAMAAAGMKSYNTSPELTDGKVSLSTFVKECTAAFQAAAKTVAE